MRENGIKFTPENIVRIEKLPDGKIVFLEKGRKLTVKRTVHN